MFLVLPAGLPQSGKLPVLNLLTVHRTKIRFFTPQGRLVASIHVKFGSADRHLGPLGCAIFHINRPLLYLLLTLFIVYLSKKFRRGQGRLCSSKGEGRLCHGTMAQWPVQACFKVTTFFDIEYLRIDTRYSHDHYRASIGSHMRCIVW